MDSLDTSYWPHSDEAWLADRKKSWADIHQMLMPFKSKKGLDLIQKYYLKGVIPNWKNLVSWPDDGERHLDVFCFLWLHPSSDEHILRDLFLRYINSEDVELDDIVIGYRIFRSSQREVAFRSEDCGRVPDYPLLGKKGIVLFKVMFSPDKAILKSVRNRVDHDYQFDNACKNLIEFRGYQDLATISLWLSQEKDSFNKDFIFQYQEFLDWWYPYCKQSGSDHLLNGQPESDLESFCRVLKKILFFDVEKEGNTVRTQLVLKLKSIFDEREFTPDFKKILNQVKNEV